VGVVVRPPADSVAARIPGVGRVHVFDKYGADRGWGGLRRVAGELRRHDYQVAFIPHPSPRSSLLAFLAKIPRRVGDGRHVASWFLTDAVASQRDDTFVSARLRLVSPELAADASRRRLSGGLVSTRGRPSTRPPRVGLVMGSAWETKRWDVAQARALVARLTPDVATLVMVGASWERGLFEALRDETTARSLDAADEQVGVSLDGLVDVLATCDVVIAGDTGPLQIARALGIPVVALFGPTSVDRHGFEDHDEALRVDIDCAPCSPHGHRRCPLGHHRCMTDLSAVDVYGAVMRVLQR
jgi:heptosyltransferase II